jgi:hypothetical protein
VGLAIAVVLGGGYMAAAYQSGPLQRVLSGELPSVVFRATFTGTILVAYVPTAHYYLVRWTRSHLEDLKPLLRPPARPRVDLAPGWTAGGVGFVSFAAFYIVPTMSGPRLVDSGTWTSDLVSSILVPVARVAHLPTR